MTMSDMEMVEHWSLQYDSESYYLTLVSRLVNWDARDSVEKKNRRINSLLMLRDIADQKRKNRISQFWMRAYLEAIKCS